VLIACEHVSGRTAKQPRFVKELELVQGTAPVVDFSIRLRPEIKSRLVDGDGRGVAGTVSLNGVRYQPGADGEFSLPDPSANSLTCVAVSEDESLAAGFYWQPDDEPLRREIVMSPWAIIEGRLIGEGDLTAETFAVELAPSRSPLSRDLWRVTISENRQFQLWVPPGVRLRAFAQGPKTQGEIVECDALQPGETRTRGDVVPAVAKPNAVRRRGIRGRRAVRQ
jgi:hypothetical protein